MCNGVQPWRFLEFKAAPRFRCLITSAKSPFLTASWMESYAKGLLSRQLLHIMATKSITTPTGRRILRFWIFIFPPLSQYRVHFTQARPCSSLAVGETPASGLLHDPLLQEGFDVPPPKDDLFADLDEPDGAALHQPIEHPATEAQIFHRFGLCQELSLCHGSIISRGGKIKRYFSCQPSIGSLSYA